jgi:hypothetical protein
MYSQSPALSFGRRVSWWAFGESHVSTSLQQFLGFCGLSAYQQFLPLLLLVSGCNYGPARIEDWLLCEMLRVQ